MVKLKTSLQPGLTSSIRLPLVRQIGALTYSALLTLLLVQSSRHPLIGPAAPDGHPDLLWEILLTTGHILGFSLLTAVWWWALRATSPSSRALLLAVFISLTLGLVTELAQTLVVDRSASWFDLSVNTLVTLATALSIQSRYPR